MQPAWALRAVLSKVLGLGQHAYAWGFPLPAAQLLAGPGAAGVYSVVGGTRYAAVWCLSTGRVANQPRKPFQRSGYPSYQLWALSMNLYTFSTMCGIPGKVWPGGDGNNKWLLQDAVTEGEAGSGMHGKARRVRLKDGRRVVVKICQGDPELEMLLKHEVQVLEQLAHLPCVVKLVGYGWKPSGDSYWLATGWLDDHTLNIQKYPKDAKLWAAAAKGLRQIHAAGYVHGSLKPESILILAGDPHPVRFLNFSLAHVCDEPAVRQREQDTLAELFGRLHTSSSRDDDHVTDVILWHALSHNDHHDFSHDTYDDCED